MTDDRIDQFLDDDCSGVDAAAVDALVAAGVLSPARGETWKAEHARRLASLHRDNLQHGPYDEKLEANATELLADLFAPVRPRASRDWDPAVYTRYQEALATLAGIARGPPSGHGRCSSGRARCSRLPAVGRSRSPRRIRLKCRSRPAS